MKTILRCLLAVLFLTAGVVHLVIPDMFLPIMPLWIPFHYFCILASGVLEIVGGVGLLVPRGQIQRRTGWGLALLLIAVFPANIHMATAHIRVHGFPSHAWMAWARLALQPALIVGVLWITSAWPMNCRKEAIMKPPLH